MNLIPTMLLAAACFSASATSAEPDYPTRPVRLIVGFAAGSITDITARQIAAGMGKVLGQPVVVDNRTGAGGNIASAELSRARPDGYTIMATTPGQLVVNPLTQKAIGFDPKTRFTLISLVNEGPFVFVVPANSRFRSVPQLVTWGKANAGKLTYASAGIGTTSHIAAEMLQVFGGIKAVHVPYRGGSQATNDLIAGRVDFMIDSLGSVAQQVSAGQIKVLATGGSSRLPQLPDIPTLSETYPDFIASSWLGVTGPPDLPPAVVAALAKAVEHSARDPHFVSSLEQRGGRIARPGPDAFSALVDKERARVERTVVRAGITLE
ncbi:Bug family tripartite tricarboxylate transporter substrate binding protein [Cupriavidus oxalaticus]|uniref:BugT protein n=1 Tax=Cupriavidus oxalaticus TaxID=96344 RepID=A0A375GKX4_9BURK|nr:tripartite tricarboxylate transporter substrate binding protein [Cupriavidus oxalaticus]QRQ84638.1 tripartite tricarboxylate transporter substrate binding protein [Cupriavidus oxalaticus]QRQ91273.1 tripartite tricarboxylate transporter substrate binding protein [Cupriavidus oxalaticus]WQD85831.1 tripartite tricarboxylate transporter substrate binding protein [Cupriavidus oxalaticus]SPC20643.1 BugT protein [Cupriavidus oxalaticus]